jgi:hypothetical protein
MADDENEFDSKPTPSRAARRRDRDQISDSQRERHRRSGVRGVPVVRPDPNDEVTAPLELLLNGQLDGDDYRQIEALRQSADDVYVLLMNVAKAISRHRDKDRSGSKAVETQVAQAIDEAGKQLTVVCDRLTDLEGESKETKRKLGFAQKIAATAITLALAAGGGLISKIWDRAGDEREARVRATYMQQDIDRLTKWVEHASRKDTP